MSPPKARTPLGDEIVTNPAIYDGLRLGAAKFGRGDRDAAKEMFQEMVTTALAAEARGEWSPGGEVAAVDFCRVFLVRAASRLRRQASRYAGRTVDDAAVDPPSRDPRPDDAVADKDLRAKLIEALSKDLEQRGEAGLIPLAVLRWSTQGVEGHQELADSIGCSRKDIDDAQRRLTAAGKRALAQMGLSA